jgi:hypothetical protein
VLGLVRAVRAGGRAPSPHLPLDATTPDPPLEAALERLAEAGPGTPILLHAWHRDASVVTDTVLARTAGVAWKSDTEGLIRLVNGVIVHRTEG